MTLGGSDGSGAGVAAGAGVEAEGVGAAVGIASSTTAGAMLDAAEEVSRDRVMPGYGPLSGYCTSNEMMNPSWLYTRSLGAGGKSGSSTPPTIPLRMGLSLVRSSSSPIAEVSSHTPFFAAGMIALAVSSRMRVCQAGATLSCAD